MAIIKASRKRFLLFLFFFCELLDPLLSAIVGSVVSEYICNVLILLTLVYTLLKEPRSIKWHSILLIILSLASFGISSLTHPEYHTVMFEDNNIWDKVFAIRKGLFFMLIVSLEDDPNELLGTLKISAIPVWVIYSTRVIMGTGLSVVTGSNHTYGFVFLFVSLIYSIFYMKDKKKIDLVISIISLAEILVVASRMTMVAYITFWALYLFTYDMNKENTGRKILGLIGGLLASFIITSSGFLKFIGSVMTRFGISSKIIDSIITGNTVMDGGRIYMYENNINLMRDNPWGLGVYWDRYIYKRFGYTHNIVYEIILDFGWVIGATILISLIIHTIRILRSNDNEWKLLFILFFSLSVIRLILSYSFWLDNNFWGMIAIIIGYQYFCKRRKRLQTHAIY